MKSVRFLVALALAGMSAPALADWEYASWGQTQKELVDGSGGAATEVKAAKDQRVFDMDYLARAEFEWRGIPLEVRFHFDRKNDRLAAIKLIPLDVANCGKLGEAAVAEFGEGKTRAPFTAALGGKDLAIDWQDAAKGNKMLYSDIDIGALHFCHLIYQPMADK